MRKPICLHALPLAFVSACNVIGTGGDSLDVLASPTLPSMGGGEASATAHSEGTGGNGAQAMTGGASALGPDTPGPNPDGTYPPAEMVIDGSPLYTRFVRLTNAAWDRSVQDILQLAASPDEARNFQTPISGSTDFANNESVLLVTNDLWRQYQLAAGEVVAGLTANDAAIRALYAGTDARGFIMKVGRRAFRRALTEDEISRLQVVFDTAAALSMGGPDAFTRGAGLVIETLLQSPNFVYRTELAPDGAPLSGYEVASKLSFALRGTTPSDVLLDAAAAGELDTTDGVKSAADQMLAEPESLRVFGDFHGELFNFSAFGAVSKSSPLYKQGVNAELEESSYRFFEHIYEADLGVSEMLTSTQGYVGPLMAGLYDIPAPASGSVELRDLGSTRPGYFSQVPYLLLNGAQSDSDAIHRGVHINYDVLCASIPPPPFVVSPISENAPGATDREKVTLATQGCGNGCHDAYLNPIGFAFENFDGLGRARTEDSGLPVDTTGSYPFAEGVAHFDGAAQLMAAMAAARQTHACYAKHLIGYVLQRDVASADVALVDQLASASMSSRGSVKSLIIELVTSTAFTVRNGGSL